MSPRTRKKKEPKPGLLKFSGPTEYALENLRNRVIYCQHFEGFNDPFEFWTDFREGIPDLETERDRFIAAIGAWGFDEASLETALENSKEYFESLEDSQPRFKEMVDRIRIACFGSEPDNLLMWSHYADGLRGFCIVFDEDLVVKAEPKGYITDVAYLDTPPLVDSFVYAVAYDQEDYNMRAIEETRSAIRYQGKKGEKPWLKVYRDDAAAALRHMHEMWQHAFAAKPVEWRYEKERRLLVNTDMDGRQAMLRPYPKKAVREIVVGERMPPAYLARLTDIVKKQFGEIPVRTARRPSDRYTLIIE
jgi:hypothetical protein